ncbi:YciI family protein [Brevundimonas sp.]|uniref:YciI family protein n=1 Tax=Brevundimonas sp. TaxID=1871086 RepID=UPI003D6CF795
MFVILLRFSANKAAAGEFMEAHNAWLKAGFDNGVFLLAGSLQAGAGGGVIAHSATRSDLETRVAADPFVLNDVVAYEILEIAPGRTDERLAFLKA